jgi:CheY-like chemotaxis protein
MPGMSGNELMERLNLDPRTRHIAVILFHS